VPALDFRIDVTRPATAELSVSLECAMPAALPGAATAELRLFLPTWTPGSYLIREFARHLGRVTAVDPEHGNVLECRKVEKNRFVVRAPAGTRRVRLHYPVYAHELSVRTADVTAEHAYWNHACLLLWPVDQPALQARLEVAHPAAWQLACSLPREGPTTTADRTATTTLLARDLDDAMDAPCLVGSFQQLGWEVDGVPHAIVMDGLAGIAPPPKLVADLTAIVVAAKAVFGGALPYDAYTFLCLFAADGHGGLEHRSSTTLLSSRTEWVAGKGYREFLGLAAHELFHAWNVKRLRPVEFWTYDYERENYTELLWLIEGWTAYYDDLLCQRAGLVGRDDYLAILAKSVTTVLASPGRMRLSLAESSFDAWIRLYRPDENTRNSSQNYYVNGSIAAVCLDLTIRRESGGAICLDDVLRTLWRRTYEKSRGYTLADVRDAVRDLAGATALATLDALTGEALDPDLAATFAPFGIRVVARDTERPHLGITFEAGSTRVASITRGSPAHDAGIAPGDEVLAIQNLRVDAQRWQGVFEATAKVDQPVDVLLARRGVITHCIATPRRNPGTVALEVDPAASAQQKKLLEGWLRSDVPATS